MTIKEKRKGRILIFYLSGQLDSKAANDFAKMLTRHIEKGEREILLNFECLTYLSSTGLRVLLGTAQHVDAQGGKIFLCALSPAVLQSIELVGFHRILHIYASEHEAVKHF